VKLDDLLKIFNVKWDELLPFGHAWLGGYSLLTFATLPIFVQILTLGSNR
jgi:hypothetical protein